MNSVSLNKKSVTIKLIGLLVAILLIVIDQISKAIVADVKPQGVTFIPNFVYFTFVVNRGAAFSFLEGKEWAMTFFITLTSISMVIFLVVYFLLPTKKALFSWAIVFVMAGAMGNLIDRVVLDGVRDFVDVFYFNVKWHFANCNIADFYITGGAIAALIGVLFIDEDYAIFPLTKKAREKRRSEKQEDKLKKAEKEE